ncbi:MULTISPECIES: hypothetical protein [Vibrio]|uniref:Outer membrane protein n=2 Tax=Vibrio TaxID=662 RepID=A0A7X4LJD4_9VIBR|nr:MULTISPECIES: hypothetical protein [Vibrio]MBF9002387.1 hypothetical protein [Vibrio nitrifigilis]MZI93030.1 hypothetical protein [Vibrio eleionomae]
MNIKPLYLTSLGLLMINQAYAAMDVDDTVKGKTYLQYEHNYQTENRRHGDSIKLVHKTPENWGFEVKFGIYPRDSDYAYENYYGGSAGFVLSKSYILDKKSYLSPQFEIDFQSDSLQYLAGATLYRKLSTNWGGYVRYRYQFRDYASTDSYKTRDMYINGDSSQGTESVSYLSKGNIGTHRFETGIDYRGVENWRFQYILLYDYSKYTNSPQSCDSYSCTPLKYYAFNNKHGYLYNEFKVQYTGFKSVIPYMEIDQKAVSSSTSQEQACLKAGFNWYF